MSTDIEHDLRELFRERAGDAAAAPPTEGAPTEVLRRGCRRQVATVAGSAAIAFAIAAGSAAGLGVLLRGGDVAGGSGDSDVFVRGATIEAFSLGSPSDWFLVNEWPRSAATPLGAASGSKQCGPEDLGCAREEDSLDQVRPISADPLPLLQLTNVDLGLDSDVCRDGLPDIGAALYIAIDLTADADSLDPFPPGPMPGLPEPSSDGPCGAGSYAHFTVNGYPMFSWVGWGPGATDADRTTVRTTWEQMWAHDDWQPSQPEDDTAAYVLAGGGAIGHEWQVEVRPADIGAAFSFVQDGSTGRVDLAVGDEPVSWCCYAMTRPGHAGGDVVFGAVARSATGVVFRSDAGDIAGVILPPPPSLGVSFNFFFIEGTEGIAGEVVALGVDGATEVPDRTDLSNRYAPAEERSPDQYPWTKEGPNSFITAHGPLGGGWTLQVLYYRDGYRLVCGGFPAFDGRLRLGEWVVVPLHGIQAPDDAVLLLLTRTDVERVSLEANDEQPGRWIPGTTSDGGEARLWVIELPGHGSGRLFVDGVEAALGQGPVTWP